MSTPIIVFGIILLVAALFLIVAVLMQQGKSHNLSGTIAGGAETFFGKEKAKAANRGLSIATSIIAVVFVLIVLGFYVSQATSDYASLGAYFRGEKTEAVDTNATEEHDHEHDHAEDTTADTAAAE
ncbi:MAG: preprotein translocase subunit SecG [Ruminococcaceae bacterium]|nr:preprotein translocase subunit SecG [Oscillospiraceae bacterium]